MNYNSADYYVYTVVVLFGKISLIKIYDPPKNFIFLASLLAKTGTTQKMTGHGTSSPRIAVVVEPTKAFT